MATPKLRSGLFLQFFLGFQCYPDVCGKFLILAISFCLTKINTFVNGACADDSVSNLRKFVYKWVSWCLVCSVWQRANLFFCNLCSRGYGVSLPLASIPWNQRPLPNWKITEWKRKKAGIWFHFLKWFYDLNLIVSTFITYLNQFPSDHYVTSSKEICALCWNFKYRCTTFK